MDIDFGEESIHEMPDPCRMNVECGYCGEEDLIVGTQKCYQPTIRFMHLCTKNHHHQNMELYDHRMHRQRNNNSNNKNTIQKYNLFITEITQLAFRGLSQKYKQYVPENVILDRVENEEQEEKEDVEADNNNSADRDTTMTPIARRYTRSSQNSRKRTLSQITDQCPHQPQQESQPLSAQIILCQERPENTNLIQPNLQINMFVYIH